MRLPATPPASCACSTTYRPWSSPSGWSRTGSCTPPDGYGWCSTRSLGDWPLLSQPRPQSVHALRQALRVAAGEAPAQPASGLEAEGAAGRQTPAGFAHQALCGVQAVVVAIHVEKGVHAALGF